MIDKLKELKKKCDSIKNKLVDPEVLKDHNAIAKYSKDLKEIEPIVEKYDELIYFEKEKTDAIAMIQEEVDPEMINMLKETVEDATKKINDINEELKILLLPKDPNDGKNAILEIRGAAGGDEANIFAGDLYRMYNKYFESIGWKTESLETNVAENGGYSLISFLIKGDNVFSKLKFESGSHRVQRVPQTESQGRIHTSTATVVVMPEIKAVEVNIKDSDLKIDVYRSSGAGGQSVNTTDSAVRITHMPTGIVVTSQDQRSQIQNKEKAMQVMASKIYDHELSQQLKENDSQRKLKLGSGSRSEKIRTYNYPQNRVTDHRIGLTLNKLDQVMEGKLSEIIDALVMENQLELMKASND